MTMTNEIVGNGKWMLFVRKYELTDPEPDLEELAPLKLLTGLGYATSAVDKHMAWHRRLMDAWKKEAVCL